MLRHPAPKLDRVSAALRQARTLRVCGRVTQIVGLTIEAQGLDCEIGELVEIRYNSHGRLPAEVVGFRDERTLLMPLGEMRGIQPGSPVIAEGQPFHVPVGRGLLGRVLDGLGQPIDGKGPLNATNMVPVSSGTSPHPLKRQPITEPLATGVRAIDSLITIGKGQRMGIFAGSGVGKSTLMGSIASNSRSDVSVIGLIGERGREVQEFIEHSLGPDGLARSVVVVSTSDQPALVRVKGAWVATAIAEGLREEGRDVTFMMDSVTRVAMAQREIGLAIGEPPASKGYTPSVFALMPKLMERAGTSERGTMTGFYTVLVDGDDFNEPIADAARSILDGHITLSRDLAARNHYPAIDVLHSVSRVMPAVTSAEHRHFAGRLRQVLAVYEKARDLINIGAYVKGSDPQIDEAIALLPKAELLLKQGVDPTSYEATLQHLGAIFQG
ncbi:MAG: FliI/YscN family ATPase [Chloroflexi bacterium]|nr:FliI/YscN family ATPase [Chloroflexota bacterium]